MNLALSLLLLTAPPTLTIPAEIRGEPGAFIVVRAESDSPWVNFRADEQDVHKENSSVLLNLVQLKVKSRKS